MTDKQLEQFALAEDREAVLETMIPGSVDAFTYRCLHLQNEGRLAEVDALLERSAAQGIPGAVAQRLRDRQTLLRFEQDPKGSCEYLQRRLGLSFTPARARSNEAEVYPSALDPAVIERERVTPQMLSGRSLSAISDEGIAWVLARYADKVRPTELLKRVKQPDHPGLVDVVLAGLERDPRTRFGGLEIHKNLCWLQYRELAHRRPQLLQEEEFITACLYRLRPPEHVALAREGAGAARWAYYERVWSLVAGLAPKFDPLKRHVLYYMLEHGRRAGDYDRARFLAFLELSAGARYARAQTRGRPPRGFPQHAALVGMPAIADDEPLVRDYLIALLKGAPDYQGFAQLVREDYLRGVFAEAKILHGVDVEPAYAMLEGAGARARLRDRVELEFAPTTPRYFDPVQLEGEGGVALELDVKNVQTLVVKVFEINLFNYFVAHGRDVDASIDLDGLVATHEQTRRYDEPPHRRVRRRFAFPELKRPGVYVVEFIGGGKSSRALLRIGRLRFTHRIGAAGHVFQVVDERGAARDDATLWLSGREHRADEDGRVVVPFAADRGGPRRFLLRVGDRVTVESFTLLTEQYAFTAAFHVEREALIAGHRAELFVRPELRIHGEPVSVSLIKTPRLRIESTDVHGVNASMEVGDFTLRDHGLSVHAFTVPEGLSELTFTLSGRVRNEARGEDVDVTATSRVRVNGIERSEHVASFQLARGQGGYRLYALGKAGEPRVGQHVTVILHHRLFSRTISETLQTDARGCVTLGELVDIHEVAARGAGVTEGSWTLPGDDCSLPPVVQSPARAIRLARPRGDALTRERYSLIQLLGGRPLRDCFENLAFVDGALELRGLEAGRYRLRYKRLGRSVDVVVVDSDARAGGWIDGGTRLLSAWRNRPLRLLQAGFDDDTGELRVRVVGPKQRPRVYIFGDRFVSDRQSARALAPGEEIAGAPGSLDFPSLESLYQAGRDIGDEYRYILERRSSQRRYPGNLLKRPQLLLDPWAVRSTGTQVAKAASGGAYASATPASMRPSPRGQRLASALRGQAEVSATLDFLARPGVALHGLRVGEDGFVRGPGGEPLSAALFAGMNELRIVVLGRDGDALIHHVHAPHVPLERRERRLMPGFDPAYHLAQRREITALRVGETLTVDDLSMATVERYDTLTRAFELLSTLTSSHARATLEKFRFVLTWPSLTPDERRERYSEFACHELNLLLARKDPAFFAEVVRPHLANKRERTFLDDYLLAADLGPYRESWAYARLNALERALLAARVGGQVAAETRRDFADQIELVPSDPERENRLFETALKGRALAGDDGEGGAPTPPPPPPRAPAPQPAGAAFGGLGGRGGGGGSRRRRSARRETGAVFNEITDEDIDGLFAADEAEAEVAEEAYFDDDMPGEPTRGAGDLKKRGKGRANFRAPDKTKELAETHYYRRELDSQGPELIPVNAFWRDFLEHALAGEEQPFISSNLADAAGEFSELLCALAVLELPWSAEPATRAGEGRGLTITANSPAIVFHRQIGAARSGREDRGLLVRHHYMRADDRERIVDGRVFAKFLNPKTASSEASDEFLIHTVYVCKVVVTNASAHPRKLELLLQIPAGAMPVKAGHVTRGVHSRLEPYSTVHHEYAFYFPAPGDYRHYPAHASEHGALLAAAEPATLGVVAVASKLDRDTWPHVVSHGDDEDVLEFLRERNLRQIGAGVERVAPRMYKREMYTRVLEILRRRQRYSEALWSFSLFHQDAPAIAEFLRHEHDFLRECGPALQSALLTIDPFDHRRYQHLEYAPLINARAHRFANHPTILNDRFGEQWTALLRVLAHQPRLRADDRLAVAYYLLLQERIDEGLAMFDTIERDAVAAAMQYDYLAVYAAFYRALEPGESGAPRGLAEARAIATRWRDVPVARWRDRFRDALAQLDEIAGADARATSGAARETDREARHDHLARTEASFDFSVEGGSVALRYHNIRSCKLHFYRMDIELLFSRQPFVQEQSGQFGFVAPNLAFSHELAAAEGEGEGQRSFPIPESLAGANVLIEVVAAGKRKSVTHYANSLSVRLIGAYGQVRVAHERTGAPLPRVYVKAYARDKSGGGARFYKDGYTDLRGVFDYASLSTDELDRVERFALLILSEEHGAVIREVAPPER